jgi:hypothetical protein
VDVDDNNRSAYMPEWFVNRTNWFNFATENNLKIVIEMKKITFRSMVLNGNNAAQRADGAYSMVWNALKDKNIELPSLLEVKAELTGQHTRGPAPPPRDVDVRLE